MKKLFKLASGVALALGLMLFATTPVLAGDVSGPTVLTVTGEVSNPNRTGYNADTDKFFGYSDVDFEKAAIFSFGSLSALQTVSVKADFPKGGQVHTFEGPLLADVLAAAGATGKTVFVQALDGYVVEAPLDELIAQGAVVALERNGEKFGIGDFGPTQIVFPRPNAMTLQKCPTIFGSGPYSIFAWNSLRPSLGRMGYAPGIREWPCRYCVSYIWDWRSSGPWFRWSFSCLGSAITVWVQAR